MTTAKKETTLQEKYTHADALLLLAEVRKFMTTETNWAKHDCKVICDGKGQELLFKLNDFLK